MAAPPIVSDCARSVRARSLHDFTGNMNETREFPADGAAHSRFRGCPDWWRARMALILPQFACEPHRSAVFNKLLLAIVLMFATSAAARADKQTLWLENGRAIVQASEMLDAMRNAELYGLRPADYAVRISAEDLQAVLSGHADSRTSQRF